VSCDSGRIAQLLSNLLANAVTHGDPEGAVHVTARALADVFELWVENEGPDIQPDVQAQLFGPFYRASVAPNQQGLGLGLYIASQIASAHGGTLEVESGARRTRFVFRMPIQ
jgi:signal transduction histidine kinase